MKEILKKENRVTLIVSIICFVMIGLVASYTYSFFSVGTTNNTIIAGEAETLGVGLTVTKTAPSDDSKLIPQLDAYIDKAIIGRQGSCIDDNGNTVCHTYKITVTNNGGNQIPVSATVELDSSTSPNLRWAIYQNITNGTTGETTPSLVGNIKGSTEDVLIQNETFTGLESREYLVVVWISETRMIQTDSGSYTGVVNVVTQDVITPNMTLASYTVDGSTTTTMPKGSYEVTTNSANLKFDYENWGFEISNVDSTGLVTFNPTFTSTTKKYLNTYIKDTLTGTEQGNGQVVNENGYRYEGANPNNYIKFNNELWRIIGVFDETSHGQSGEYLTKIIIDKPIGKYAWDKNNVNIWPQSSLYNLLNTYYYNADDGTESGYCYKYSTTVTGDCDYTIGGINDTYRPMVKNVTWYLGGFVGAFEQEKPANVYTNERSTSDTYYYTNNRSYKTTTGYIGLMYLSDYGYSVLASSCARTTDLYLYGTDACAGNSWLFSNGTEWTIVHGTGGPSYLYNVNWAYGKIVWYGASQGFATRPVLYLDSSVYILSGEGTKSNPYVIAM